MSKPTDEDDNAAGGAVFDNSRRSRAQRIRDFIEASGLEMNDVLDVIRKQPITLEDCVTDAHRDIVIDLKACGCPDADVARFLKISLERCQRLFEWELSNGTQLRTVQHVRALNVNSIQLGDTSAQLGYLRLQPDLKWGTKNKHEETAPAPSEDQTQQLAANEAFIAGITAGLAIDTTKYKKPDQVRKPPPAAESKKIAYTKGTVRKPRGED